MEGVIVVYLHRNDALTANSPLPYAGLEIFLCLIFIVSSAYYVRTYNIQRAVS
jgi:hypothetical protein